MNICVSSKDILDIRKTITRSGGSSQNHISVTYYKRGEEENGRGFAHGEREFNGMRSWPGSGGRGFLYGEYQKVLPPEVEEGTSDGNKNTPRVEARKEFP